MNKNIIALIFGLLSIFGLQAQALQDTVLTRQLELQREFNPTLQDANKINSLPILREPQITKANTDYASWTTKATPPIEIALAQPGKIMTDIPYSLQKGYVKFNAGNYANIDGALGVNFVNNEANRLNFMFLHNSTNGKLNYNQGEKLEKVKMKNMDNLAKLSFKHMFEASEFDIQASFLHSQFNYFGNNFGEERIHGDNNQQLSVFNFNTSLYNTLPQSINYRGAFSYNYFSTKYGRNLNDDSMGGSHVEADLDLNKSFIGGDNLIGVKGEFTGVFYDDISTLNEEEDISNFIMVDANPYIHLEGFNWKMRLGANLDFVFDDENKFYLSPNVALSTLITENTSLYINAMGGVSKNTYLDMYRESRYLLPNTIVKHSNTPFAIDGGAKIGAIDGFRIDLFGGYKKTKDEHFLVLNQNVDLGDDPIFGPPNHVQWTFQEFLTPIFGELSHSHVGARVHSNIWSPLDVAVEVKKNFYSVSKIKGLDTEPAELKAWNKPGLEVDIDATFSVTEDLKVMLNYYLANERWSIDKGKSVKMDDINSLSLGALYNIHKMFTVNLKANNILNQTYDMWYGHPAQGVNLMGGFTFKF